MVVSGVSCAVEEWSSGRIKRIVSDVYTGKCKEAEREAVNYYAQLI